MPDPAGSEPGGSEPGGSDPTPNPERVTLLLAQLKDGARECADALLAVVYDELRVLARAKMAHENPGLTLQPTALVHEAYLRLVKEEGAEWQNRAHFFSAAAEAMRRILVERARRVRRLKHGGEHQRVAFDSIDAPAETRSVDVIALDEALERFEQLDPRRAEVVKLRYFVGLSVEEAAETLNVSPRTVNTDWNLARAWLKREIDRDAGSASGAGDS